jgi:ferredoxin
VAINISRFVKKNVFGTMVERMDLREDEVAAIPGAYHAVEDSPKRFHIMKEAMARDHHRMPNVRSRSMMGSVMGIFASLRDLSKNPAQPKTEMGAGELAEFEDCLRGLGICSIGYTRVPARWIFEGKAILHSNAIVTAMEMDKTRIDTAPGPKAGEAAHDIYYYQGKAINRGADWLRQRGCSAHAGHPLMGLALYPPLAQLAGIGQLGFNGLIITPEHGPRVRLAAIFTSIENLPFNSGNPHSWVLDYCRTCQICVRECPQEAIFPEPYRHENGQITCVDNDRCFPYFIETVGCSVCIKVCPFNHAPYERIRETYEHKKEQVPA